MTDFLKSFKIYLYPRNSSWWDVRLWKLWLLGSLAQSLKVFQYIRLSRKCKFCQYLTNSSGAMFLKDFFMFLKWFPFCFYNKRGVSDIINPEKSLPNNSNWSEFWKVEGWRRFIQWKNVKTSTNFSQNSLIIWRKIWIKLVSDRC